MFNWVKPFWRALVQTAPCGRFIIIIMIACHYHYQAAPCGQRQLHSLPLSRQQELQDCQVGKPSTSRLWSQSFAIRGNRPSVHLKIKDLIFQGEMVVCCDVELPIHEGAQIQVDTLLWLRQGKYSQKWNACVQSFMFKKIGTFSSILN